MPRALVVDDDDDVRRLLTIQLFLQGYQVLPAAGSAEAQTIVRTQGVPDVAVIDVKLPGMTGFELLQLLRAQGDLPAVLLSGKVQQRDVDAGRALGALYVTKPYEMGTLVAAMHRAIELASSDA